NTKPALPYSIRGLLHYHAGLTYLARNDFDSLFGGSLCANSGYSPSMTARISSQVIGSRSLACQGAADAASQAREGLPLRPLAFLPPLPWNDLVESPFRLGRVAWRYTPRIRQCVGWSRLSACAQVLSPPFPQSSSASRFTAGHTFFILTQSRERRND